VDKDQHCHFENLITGDKNQKTWIRRYLKPSFDDLEEKIKNIAEFEFNEL
jgi:hypothetical protein